MGDSQTAPAVLAILGLVGGFLLVVLLVVLVANLILSYFIWSAYRVVPAQHRSLPAGLVWLCAVPCIGSIMLVVVGVMVPQAFQAAFRERRRTEFGDCGLVLGMVGSIGALVGPLIPVLGGLIGFGCLIVYVVFVVKLHEYKRALLRG